MQTAPETKASPSSWRAPLGIAGGAWLALAVLFVTQAMLLTRADLGTAISRAAPMWLLWAVAAPLITWLGFRFPLERKRLALGIAVHAIACAFIAAADQMVVRQQIPADAVGGPPWLQGNREDGNSGRPFGPPPWVISGDNPGPPAGAARFRIGAGPPGARVAFDALMYAILVSICQTVVWSRRARKREVRALIAESRFSEARLATLRAQLNPHFLFNALNGISTLIHTHPKSADAMLGDLSELLRASLETGEKCTIPLRRELDLIRAYLAIERRRFGARLNVSEDIATDVLDAKVPSLILQPLVENAVKHGIEPISRPGAIAIRAVRSGDSLRISVSDTGAGLESPSAEGCGIGLTNTRARLEQLYPARSQCTLTESPAGGCEVTIELPLELPA